MIDTLLVHGTVVAIEGEAMLLRGPPGAGKSDLALRLIDGGARLVADDQALLRRADNQVLARAPAAIAGLIEVRGVGILRVDPAEACFNSRGVPMAITRPLSTMATRSHSRSASSM